MHRPVLAFALALATTACIGPEDGPGGPARPHVSEAQLHERVRPPYADLAACELDRVGDPFLQCEESVALCPDGSVRMQIDDGFFDGTYQIVGAQVQVMFPGGSQPLIFAIGAGWSLTSTTFGDRPFLLDRNGSFDCGGGGGGLDGGVPI